MKRGRSKALFFRCAQRKIHFRSRTCQFFMRPRELGLRTSHLRVDRKRHLRSHQFHRSCYCAAALLSRVAHDFRNPPDALGDDSSLIAVTQQLWRACVRRMLRCRLACILDPFAAKDEGRDRFIGDSPLNSRERSTGRAHSPHCPRLRRMILGKSETVTNYNSRRPGLFSLVRGSPFFTRGETGGWSSHPPESARTLGR